MNLSFVTIYTDRIQESVDFYTKVMGFKIQRELQPAPGRHIVFLEDERGSTLEFLTDPKVGNFVGKGISLGFTVEDIEATLKHLKENNVKILSEPISLPSGIKLMSACDLNGVVIGFVQEA